MAYPCQDCGKVLATQGGLDVHRAQWCSGLAGDAAAAALPSKLRRRDRRRQEREAKRQPAGGAEPHREVPDLVAVSGGQEQVAPDDPSLTALAAIERAGWIAPPGLDRDRLQGGGHAGAEADLESREDSDDHVAPAIDLRGDEERIELSLIMWLMRRRVHTDRLPPGRTVVRFNFSGSGKESYWLVLDPPGVSLLAIEPRHAADVVVTADADAFKRVFQGRMLLADALGDELVHLEGPEAVVQSVPRWFEWSHPLATTGEQPV